MTDKKLAGKTIKCSQCSALNRIPAVGGSDPTVTNYAGGNTSAKGSSIDPATGRCSAGYWVAAPARGQQIRAALGDEYHYEEAVNGREALEQAAAVHPDLVNVACTLSAAFIAVALAFLSVPLGQFVGSLAPVRALPLLEEVRGRLTPAEGVSVEIECDPDGQPLALVWKTIVETADLHERFAPGNPDWGHPPFEDEVRTSGEAVTSPPERSAK